MPTTNSPVTGSLAMIQPTWHHVSGSEDFRAGELYQTSLMAALIAGLYEGETTYGEIRKHGDFGLGTFNELDGEMVGFDGTFYQLRSDGTARPVAPEQKTPFAVVTFFRSEKQLDLAQPVTKDKLLALIEQATDANLFSAVRVDGIFDEVRTRTVQRQAKPFPPLTEAAKHQAEKVFAKVQGTLAGFRSPVFAQGIGVAGFHLHFLRQDKQAGGHALDYRLQAGKVQVCTVHDLKVELPTSAEFLKTNFEDKALNEEIRAAEG
ncbi:MAG: acetolactate decarboxylase [Acidobacteriaceae bacterium]|nr:acetolactate decarboxylase [Acidobacteriaceae bacterium]